MFPLPTAPPLTLTSGQPDAPGILIFPDVKKLKDHPNKEEHDDRPLLADYAPDRIIFSLKPKGAEKLKVYGIVSPFLFSCFFPILTNPSLVVRS